MPKIVAIEDLRYDGWVYDVKVEEDSSFVANGLVVHNCEEGVNPNAKFTVLSKADARRLVSFCADGSCEIDSYRTSKVGAAHLQLAADGRAATSTVSQPARGVGASGAAGAAGVERESETTADIASGKAGGSAGARHTQGWETPGSSSGGSTMASSLVRRDIGASAPSTGDLSGSDLQLDDDEDDYSDERAKRLSDRAKAAEEGREDVHEERQEAGEEGGDAAAENRALITLRDNPLRRANEQDGFSTETWPADRDTARRLGDQPDAYYQGQVPRGEAPYVDRDEQPGGVGAVSGGGTASRDSRNEGYLSPPRETEQGKVTPDGGQSSGGPEDREVAYWGPGPYQAAVRKTLQPVHRLTITKADRADPRVMALVGRAVVRLAEEPWEPRRADDPRFAYDRNEESGDEPWEKTHGGRAGDLTREHRRLLRKVDGGGQGDEGEGNYGDADDHGPGRPLYQPAGQWDNDLWTDTDPKHAPDWGSEEYYLNKAGENWIGFDFDGTLADTSSAFHDERYWKPNPEVVAEARRLIEQGADVRIFSARIDQSPEDAPRIQRWCQKWLGRVVPVTNTKKPQMRRFYDDRAIPVRDGKIVPVPAVAKAGTLNLSYLDPLLRKHEDSRGSTEHHHTGTEAQTGNLGWSGRRIRRRPGSEAGQWRAFVNSPEGQEWARQNGREDLLTENQKSPKTYRFGYQNTREDRARVALHEDRHGSTEHHRPDLASSDLTELFDRAETPEDLERIDHELRRRLQDIDARQDPSYSFEAGDEDSDPEDMVGHTDQSWLQSKREEYEDLQAAVREQLDSFKALSRK